VAALLASFFQSSYHLAACCCSGCTPCNSQQVYWGGGSVTSRYFHRKAVLSTLDELGRLHTSDLQTRPANKTSPIQALACSQWWSAELNHDSRRPVIHFCQTYYCLQP
jgi:hypothetical protein